MTERRVPPPWSVEELDVCFIVKDSAGQKLAFVYYEEEPGSALSRQATHLHAAVCRLQVVDPVTT
jgi:hypothetical protein